MSGTSGGATRRPDRPGLFLTLITNAVVLWTTTYLGDALAAHRADGYPITDEAVDGLSTLRLLIWRVPPGGVAQPCETPRG